jgi:hypothetical protein
MRRKGRAIAIVATAVAVMGLWSSASAGASVVFGSNLANPANLTLCSGVTPGSCTWAISTLAPANSAPGGARAPSDGVIVSWRVKGGSFLSTASHSVRLRVIHGTTAAATGPLETLPAAVSTYSYSARLPVHAGDQLGIDTIGATAIDPVIVASNSIPETTEDFWEPALGEGEERAPTGDEQPGTEMLINATIEPDADHDGYGDETQDACPLVAGAGACPSTAQTPPDTVIKKGPKGTIGVTHATFRFQSQSADAGFECKLDKGKFKPCGSPRKYKHLTPGKHKFSVRAVGASGLRDASPATRKFKVDV